MLSGNNNNIFYPEAVINSSSVFPRPPLQNKNRAAQGPLHSFDKNHLPYAGITQCISRKINCLCLYPLMRQVQRVGKLHSTFLSALLKSTPSIFSLLIIIIYFVLSDGKYRNKFNYFINADKVEFSR